MLPVLGVGNCSIVKPRAGHGADKGVTLARTAGSKRTGEDPHAASRYQWVLHDTAHPRWCSKNRTSYPRLAKRNPNPSPEATGCTSGRRDIHYQPPFLFPPIYPNLFPAAAFCLLPPATPHPHFRPSGPFLVRHASYLHSLRFLRDRTVVLHCESAREGMCKGVRWVRA